MDRGDVLIDDGRPAGTPRGRLIQAYPRYRPTQRLSNVAASFRGTVRLQSEIPVSEEHCLSHTPLPIPATVQILDPSPLIPTITRRRDRHRKGE